MFQDSVPAGSYNDPFLSSVRAHPMDIESKLVPTLWRLFPVQKTPVTSPPGGSRSLVSARITGSKRVNTLHMRHPWRRPGLFGATGDPGEYRGSRNRGTG